MRREERGHPSGATGKDGTLPFRVYPEWPPDTERLVGHRSLLTNLGAFVRLRVDSSSRGRAANAHRHLIHAEACQDQPVNLPLFSHSAILLAVVTRAHEPPPPAALPLGDFDVIAHRPDRFCPVWRRYGDFWHEPMMDGDRPGPQEATQPCNDLL